jgi:hypothetical protein
VALTTEQLQAQLDALITAYNSGATAVVTSDGKSVTYTPGPDMLARIRWLRGQLGLSTGAGRGGVSYIRHRDEGC